MPEKFIRNIFYYKDYFPNFFNELSERVKKKFDWTLELIATNDRIPIKYFEHLTGTKGLYEIRVAVGTDTFRAFAFFDEGQLIIVANGFQKKTQIYNPARRGNTTKGN